MGCVTVVDYGMGNLLSVRRAFEYIGADVVLTADPGDVDEAERLVLPGVGAFADGMMELRERGLVEPIRRFAASARPLLAICLGMHLLLEESAEFGRHEGLGILPGRVAELPRSSNGKPNKVPHIGWSSIRPPEDASHGWKGSPLEPLHADVDVYFVHSFVAEPADPEFVLAEVRSERWAFPAALRQGSVVGTQFHPEKSGPAGLAIVRAFAATA